jgi:hypothetical protein
MRIIDISKEVFDEIKNDMVNWLDKKLNEDPDTIFQFRSDFTKEDINYIMQNSDHFIIDKNKVIKIDSQEVEEDKYEILMKAGRKYYNKLQKYPIANIGIINVMNIKMDYMNTLLKYLVFSHTFIILYIVYIETYP